MHDHHKIDKHLTTLMPCQFPITIFKQCINPNDIKRIEGPLLNIGASAPPLVPWRESQVIRMDRVDDL